MILVRIVKAAPMGLATETRIADTRLLKELPSLSS